MGRFSSALVLAASVTQVLGLCSHGTFLHPRAEEGGSVEVKTFGYTGEIGPLFWSALEAPTNSICSTGTRQSPIDMTAGTFNMVPASDVEVNIPDFTEGTEFENLGTTVEVVAKPGGTLKIGGKTFELQQFHFHLPSEHLDNGTSRAMEMHMVWQSAEQEIAVIGTYIDVAREGETAPVVAAPVAAPVAEPAPANVTAPVLAEPAPAAKSRFRRKSRMQAREEAAAAPPATLAPTAAPANGPSTLLETVFSLVGQIATPGTVTKTPALVLSEFVDLWRAGSFQGYSGSLTTPPCSEGVHWLVSTQTLRIMPSTFERVRDVIGYNARYTQNAPGKQNVLQLGAERSLGLAAAAPPAAAPPAAEPAATSAAEPAATAPAAEPVAA
ncbi:alpha carbonic anhydrase [Cercophora scortea]|uniref:carbonic anhydrase n=1 Tax=Cercophora scortea TaxID=314031 RepID=A0AAE0IX34_9PEZI|nr:alpha carbonic anhydrase [Cercophora scortea]